MRQERSDHNPTAQSADAVGLWGGLRTGLHLPPDVLLFKPKYLLIRVQKAAYYTTSDNLKKPADLLRMCQTC